MPAAKRRDGVSLRAIAFQTTILGLGGVFFVAAMARNWRPEIGLPGEIQPDFHLLAACHQREAQEMRGVFYWNPTTTACGELARSGGLPKVAEHGWQESCRGAERRP